ncbi:ABC transporter permease [Escherichia coli]|uniref:Efflux ABC transporter, permease protein n=1 Tax=Escherichia coli TA447 TaxID=656447 RepID=A0A1X3ITA1_ECOLX|nr:ABC transporter permease [Escherichia coli]OSK88081.1 efflux ABC transporter, permease protein [Escherichia coli TA447]
MIKILIFIFWDALHNLNENKRSAAVFLVFLSLSFIGIIIIDSIIYSVSEKAGQELHVNGEKQISIEFYQPVTKETLKNALGKFSTDISFSKRMFMRVSDSPFSEDSESILGIDKKGMECNCLYPGSDFEGNVAIVSKKISPIPSKIFIGEIPFKVVGVKEEADATFLSSLGIDINHSRSLYYIPLMTMAKLTLSNSVTGAILSLKNNVTNEVLDEIHSSLTEEKLTGHFINSSINAKQTVDNVLNRFRLLTNTIYIVLNLSAITVIITICRRNFQLRATEFALKIIHGVNIKNISYVVIFETIMMATLSITLSIFLSFLSLHFLSRLLSVVLELRFEMLTLSFSILILISVFSNVLFSLSFFKKEAITLIKRRSL